MRRKTLRNNLKGVISAEQLQALEIDPTRRPETLALPDFICIADFIHDNATTETPNTAI